MRVTWKCPFASDHYAQLRAIPGRTLGEWYPEHRELVKNCLINGAFVEDWPAYVPQQSDTLMFFAEPGAVALGLAELGSAWAFIINAAITVAASTLVNLGVNAALRALMPTPHQTEGRTEAAFGISGLTVGPGLPAPMVYANQRHHVAPGMEPLLRRVLGLPFRLGAEHPDAGALDCRGLVVWMLGEYLAQQIAADHNSLSLADPVSCFAPVWAASDRTAVPGGWRALMRAWDVLCWQDRTADALLRSRGHTEAQQWLHVALCVAPDVVVTSIIDGVVQLLDVEEIREGADEEVLALVRAQFLSDNLLFSPL